MTIVGAGHGGCVLATSLALRGFCVTLVKLGNTMHVENFDQLAQTREINYWGIHGEGKVGLADVTRDAESAVRDADVVFVVYVSRFQADVAKAVAGFMHAGQLVVLGPGYCGSLLFEKELKQSGSGAPPLFVEMETLPFMGRITEPGVIKVSSKNLRHPFAAQPSSRTEEATQRMAELLDGCIARDNIVEVALHNPNLIIHTTGVILNATTIERTGPDFHMYQHGFTPATWNVVRSLDDEKMAVLEAIGCERISYFDAFRLRTYGDEPIDALDGFMRYAETASKGPATLETRYVTEDVPMGLGLLHSVGNSAGVPTPTCAALVQTASVVCGKDFWAQARTIESLGYASAHDLLADVRR